MLILYKNTKNIRFVLFTKISSEIVWTQVRFLFDIKWLLIHKRQCMRNVKLRSNSIFHKTYSVKMKIVSSLQWKIYISQAKSKNHESSWVNGKTVTWIEGSTLLSIKWVCFAVGIQNFPGVGAPTLEGDWGAPTYDFARFSQKEHEIERIWTPP